MLERIGVGELVLLNFQPIQIQMLQGFVFHLGRTGEKELGSWREFNDEAGQRKRKYNCEWQKAVGREGKTLMKIALCIYYIYI